MDCQSGHLLEQRLPKRLAPGSASKGDPQDLGDPNPVTLVMQEGPFRPRGNIRLCLPCTPFMASPARFRAPGQPACLVPVSCLPLRHVDVVILRAGRRL